MGSPKVFRNWSNATSSAGATGISREGIVRQEMRALRGRRTAVDAGSGKTLAQAIARRLADCRRFKEPEALAQIQRLLPHPELRQRARAHWEHPHSPPPPQPGL